MGWRLKGWGVHVPDSPITQPVPAGLMASSKQRRRPGSGSGVAGWFSCEKGSSRTYKGFLLGGSQTVNANDF